MPVLNNEVLDDPPIWAEQIDFSAGQNSAGKASEIAPNECQLIQNGDILLTGRLRKRIGHSNAGIVSASNAVQGMGYMSTPTIKKLLIACNATMYGYNGSAIATVPGYTPTAGARVEMAQLVDKMFIVDGNENLEYWDGTTFTSQPSPGAGYKYICKAGQRIFVACYNNGSSPSLDQVAASNLRDGTVYDSLFTFNIGGDGDTLTGMLPWYGNNVVFFKSNEIYVVNADPTVTALAGGASMWANSELGEGVGCEAHRSAIQIGNQILFLSRDGVRSLNSPSLNSTQFTVSDPMSLKIEDWIERINWAAADTSWATFWKNTYRLNVPVDGSAIPNVCLVYNTLKKAWAGVWPSISGHCQKITKFGGVKQLFMGMDNGKLWLANDYKNETSLTDADYQDDGADYVMKVIPRAFDFGDPYSPKTGDYFELEMEELESGGEFTTAAATLDEDNENSVVDSMEVASTTLPVTLPFDLTPQGTNRLAGDILQFEDFRTISFPITNTQKQVTIRAIRASAYLDTVQEEIAA